jgi:hypothetical protein
MRKEEEDLMWMYDCSLLVECIGNERNSYQESS